MHYKKTTVPLQMSSFSVSFHRNPQKLEFREVPKWFQKYKEYNKTIVPLQMSSFSESSHRIHLLKGELNVNRQAMLDGLFLIDWSICVEHSDNAVGCVSYLLV